MDGSSKKGEFVIGLLINRMVITQANKPQKWFHMTIHHRFVIKECVLIQLSSCYQKLKLYFIDIVYKVLVFTRRPISGMPSISLC